MFQLVFLATSSFLVIEGSIAAFWPNWTRRKMADLQDVPVKTLGFVGIFFVIVGFFDKGPTVQLLDVVDAFFPMRFARTVFC